jgi:hypothetical protein
MSVAIAIATDAFGLVLSDSRRVESGGESCRDDFDKTFSVDSPSLVGAFTGLVEFGGLTVGQHVQEIVREEGGHELLNELAETIGEGLAAKLAEVSDAEVGFAHRKVELLLVGRGRLTKGKPRICSIEVTPDAEKQKINPVSKLWATEDYYVTIGDDCAREQIRRRLPPAQKKFLFSSEGKTKEMVIRAVSYGISRCGVHPLYPEINSCGGETRIRTLS